MEFSLQNLKPWSQSKTNFQNEIFVIKVVIKTCSKTSYNRDFDFKTCNYEVVALQVLKIICS